MLNRSLVNKNSSIKSGNKFLLNSVFLGAAVMLLAACGSDQVSEEVGKSNASTSSPPSALAGSSSSSLLSSNSSSSEVSIVGVKVLIEESSSKGVCSYQGGIDAKHAGFSGVGFIDSTAEVGADIVWSVAAQAAGNFAVSIRYAHGGAQSRSATLLAREAGYSSVMSFDGTAGWADWRSEQASISLVEGMNTISLSALSADGLANVDAITFIGEGLSVGDCSKVGGSNSSSSASSSSSANVGGNIDDNVDPSQALTAVAFFPSKGRINSCADASVSIQFNRTPVIKKGGKIQIHEASGNVFDGVTANPKDGLYFADLVSRMSGGKTFKSEVLDVVFNTVVFHPKGNLQYGKTYYITVDQGMISDAAGNSFSVSKSDAWRFTVRGEKPSSSSDYTLAADGSGDYCSVESVLQALPDTSSSTRTVTVKKGVYPGIVRMKQSNVHFKGAGVDQAIFSHKNSSKMNSDREGIELSGSDVTFENMTIFNTYLKDSSGQQAEALYVTKNSKRVFLNNVHLRSHQDTLRVDGQSVYMKGGKISGSTDPLWGTGAFYCDGCELQSRTSGHAFVVARSTKGFAMVNCKVTKESASVNKTSLAQFHNNREPGKIAFINCAIDDHIVGWRRPDGNDWYEYNNTKVNGGGPVTFNGKKLSAGSAELKRTSSVSNWLGWAP